MAKALWIAVEAGIADSAKVWRFATALLTPPEAPRSLTDIELAAAIGFLVQLWGKVADKRETGDVGDVPDGLLAAWAGWRGDPARFGQCFRSTFLNDGVINDWEEHQGKLIENRKKERQRGHDRKHGKDSAGGSGGVTGGGSTGGSAESPPPDGYGNQKDSTQPPAPSAAMPPASAVGDTPDADKPHTRNTVLGLVVARLYLGRRPSEQHMATEADILSRFHKRGASWDTLAREVEGLALRRDAGELGSVGRDEPVSCRWLYDKDQVLNQRAVSEDAFYRGPQAQGPSPPPPRRGGKPTHIAGSVRVPTR